MQESEKALSHALHGPGEAVEEIAIECERGGERIGRGKNTAEAEPGKSDDDVVGEERLEETMHPESRVEG